MATLFLLLIYLSFISLGMPDSLLGSAWPVIRAEFGAELDAAGLISIIITVGTVVSSLLSYKLLTRFGAGKLTVVSVMMTALALLGAGFAGSVGWLCVVAVPLGLGGGSIDATLNNYVALHYSPRHMNWLHCFWGVGAFMGPAIMGVFIGQNNHWRGGYRTIGGVQAVICLLLFLSQPLWKNPPLPKKMAKIPAEEAPAAGHSAAQGGKTGALRIPGVIQALLTFFLYCALELGTGLWGASFLTEQRGYTAAAAASAVSLFYVGITAGRFVSGFLAARIPGGRLIRMGLAVIGLGVVLLALPLGGAGPAALALVGLGCAPIFPSMIHLTPQRFGQNHSQKIIGWQMAAAYSGNTLMPPLVGLVAARAGMGVLPWFLLCFAAGVWLFSEWANRAVLGNSRPM